MLEIYRVVAPDDIELVATYGDNRRWVEDNDFTQEYSNLEGESDEDVSQQFTGPKMVAVRPET